MVSPVDGRRSLRHLVATRRTVTRAFPPSALAAIEAAIGASERTHSGQICFAIEGSLEPGHVWRGKQAHHRALEVFGLLGVWDTDANNGVLIYVLLADRVVEIIADRGYNLRVTADEWADVCSAMERLFVVGQFEAGALEGVRRVGELIARHFPPLPAGREVNELPNRPAVL